MVSARPYVGRGAAPAQARALAYEPIRAPAATKPRRGQIDSPAGSRGLVQGKSRSKTTNEASRNAIASAPKSAAAIERRILRRMGAA